MQAPSMYPGKSVETLCPINPAPLSLTRQWLEVRSIRNLMMMMMMMMMFHAGFSITGTPSCLFLKENVRTLPFSRSKQALVASAVIMFLILISVEATNNLLNNHLSHLQLYPDLRKRKTKAMRLDNQQR